jgi:hypothetical protein
MVKEMLRHAPFTVFGAATGIVVMLIIIYFDVPGDISNVLFYILHPLHVVLSALVTTAMYRLYGKGNIWLAIIIGYTGSVGVAAVSDSVIPFLGGTLLHIPMELELPFMETAKMPYIGIAKWQVVNSAALIGIAIGYLKPVTRFPHSIHVLLSTWASLFGFTAFGIANWIPLLPYVFLFLFLAVWIPCCFSDIIYPLLWIKGKREGNTVPENQS